MCGRLDAKLSDSKEEKLLSKVYKGVEKTDESLKEIQVDISLINKDGVTFYSYYET